MLKKLKQLSEEGQSLHFIKPLIDAIDSFSFEPAIATTSAPHIRDGVDLKRWMMIVFFALIPCTLMAIWNSGVGAYVYGSSSAALMQQYYSASKSFSGYFHFTFGEGHFLPILKHGLFAFIPILIISYAVGGLWEVLFACIRRHEVSEGFLITGILFALILPPTLPYWMVAVGVSIGVILSKELFGGTGMNILNPALTCRTFLYFTFPNKMTGSIWVGTNPTHIRESLLSINQQANLSGIDAYSQATALNLFKASDEVKRIHVDAIGKNLGKITSNDHILQNQFEKFQALHPDAALGSMNASDLLEFVTNPIQSGGLGLSPEYFSQAFDFAKLKYGLGMYTNGNFFFGNMLGSLGETSTLACLLGALFLIITGVGAWRTMVATGLGALITALLFQYGSQYLGSLSGAWNPARFDLPAYKHLIIGGLAFGLVFMATDPVSAPYMKLSKWIYGGLIGFLTLIIREINPAFPEGVMLAILFANVFSPMIDNFAMRKYKRRRRVRRPT